MQVYLKAAARLINETALLRVSGAHSGYCLQVEQKTAEAKLRASCRKEAGSKAFEQYKKVMNSRYDVKDNFAARAKKKKKDTKCGVLATSNAIDKPMTGLTPGAV